MRLSSVTRSRPIDWARATNSQSQAEQSDAETSSMVSRPACIPAPVRDRRAAVVCATPPLRPEVLPYRGGIRSACRSRQAMIFSLKAAAVAPGGLLQAFMKFRRQTLDRDRGHRRLPFGTVPQVSSSFVIPAFEFGRSIAVTAARPEFDAMFRSEIPPEDCRRGIGPSLGAFPPFADEPANELLHGDAEATSLSLQPGLVAELQAADGDGGTHVYALPRSN